MPAVRTTSDGAYIYAAVQDQAGNQIVTRAFSTMLGTWEKVFEPSGGSANNVSSVPINPNLMYFYGNYGSGLQVIRHEVDSVQNFSIGPTGLTTEVCNALEVNPSNASEIICSIGNTIYHTILGGNPWQQLATGLETPITSIKVFWKTFYYPHSLFYGVNVTGTQKLYYSVNQGSSFVEIAANGLETAANISSLDGSEL